MSVTESPDLIGRVLGFRTWILGEGKLIAPFRSTPWEAGANIATCRQLHCTEAQLSDAYQRFSFNYLKYQGPDKLKGALRAFAEHFEWYAQEEQEKVPHPDCSCGLYAYWDPIRCLAVPCGEGGYRHGCQIDRPCGHQLLVMGAISGSGRTEVHELGFRCEKAEILTLIAPERLSTTYKREIQKTAEAYQTNYLEAKIGRDVLGNLEAAYHQLETQVKALEPDLIIGPI